MPKKLFSSDNTMGQFKLRIHTNFFPAGTVGFSRTLYSVLEADRYVEVCVDVKQPQDNCPIQHPVNFTLDTIDGTAGTNTL